MILRITSPIVVGLLAYTAWAVLVEKLSPDTWLPVTALTLVALWIVPSSVMLERDHKTDSVQRIDSFCFKLICYLFGTPLAVIWVNAMISYMSEL